MSDDLSAWSIRSVLISVRELDRSADFYQDVLGITEVLRRDRIAILGGDPTGSFTVFLREAHRNATATGQEVLGLRTLGFHVSSIAGLDRVEERLRARDAFRDRQSPDATGYLELLRGHDPDRLPLSFVAYEPGTTMSRQTYEQALETMYAVDL